MPNTPEPAQPETIYITVDDLVHTASATFAEIATSIAYSDDTTGLGTDQAVAGALVAYKGFRRAVDAGGSLTDMLTDYRERTAGTAGDGKWAKGYTETSTALAAELESAAATSRLPGPDRQTAGLNRLSIQLGKAIRGK